MSKITGRIFPFGIIATVLAGAILEQFDFENLRFEKPALAVVYILTFLMTVFFLSKKTEEK